MISHMIMCTCISGLIATKRWKSNYLFQFELKKDDGVLKEGAKDKDDASDHPTLYSCQTFSLPIDHNNHDVAVVGDTDDKQLCSLQFSNPKTFQTEVMHWTVNSLDDDGSER